MSTKTLETVIEDAITRAVDKKEEVDLRCTIGSNNVIVDPTTGFSYTTYRSSLDYWNDAPHNHIINSIMGENMLLLLTDLKKEKNEEAYLQTVKEILIEESRYDVNFFKNHTKRVKDLFKKVYNKEEYIIKILKISTLKTASSDIRKIRSLRNGICELVFMMSSKYDGLKLTV